MFPSANSASVNRTSTQAMAVVIICVPMNTMASTFRRCSSVGPKRCVAWMFWSTVDRGDRTAPLFWLLSETLGGMARF